MIERESVKIKLWMDTANTNCFDDQNINGVHN